MLARSLLLLFFAIFIGAEQYTYSPCPFPKLDHGRVRIKQRVNRFVKFICANRYELVGNRYATCKNGQWDAPLPVCVRTGCDVPPVSPNSIQIREHRDAWIVTFCLPGHSLVGSSAVFCDGQRWNDTFPTCIDNSIAPTRLSCDFEDVNICGWSQDELHDFDWKRWNKKTPSAFAVTGPSHDHTLGEKGSGYYMYIETSASYQNATARLLSPVYNSSLTNNGCFRFYYHMYGRTTGGLRVYQKPDSLPLYKLLDALSRDPSLLLFEQWGEQGDVWYSAAPELKLLSEDFQIVIEGIRGDSYMGDIAVDDVAILQGDECVTARLNAVVPSRAQWDGVQSCANRCSNTSGLSIGQCACTPDCVINGQCCPDFIELCLYPLSAETTMSDDLPATQKLIGETTTAEPTTVTRTTQHPTDPPIAAPTTKATTTTKSIAKPPTAKPTTPKPAPKPTTPKPTTPKPTTPKPTTPKPTTPKHTTPKHTTPKPTTPKHTTPKPTTPIPTTKSTTTSKPTTAKPKQTTAKAITTTTTLTSKPTTVKLSTMVPTTPLDVVESDIDRRKHETEVNLNKLTIDPPKSEDKPSSWKPAIITIVVIAICMSLVYLAVQSRTARGRQAIARLRGRTCRDSEVTYLNSATDDDL